VPETIATRGSGVRSLKESLLEAWQQHNAVRLALAATLVCAASFAGAELASRLRFPHEGTAIVFPSYAVLTAVLLLSSPRHWWLFLLASWLGHYLPHLSRWPNTWVLGTEIANFTKAAAAAIGIRFFCKGVPRLDSLQRAAIFLAFAVFLGPAIGAFIGAGVVVHHQAQTDYWLSWRAWFLSNALTGAMLLPAFLVTLVRGRTWLRAASRIRLIEGGTLLLSLIIVSMCAFLLPLETAIGIPASLYVPFPILLWAVARFGFGGASLAVLIVASIAVAAAVSGLRPFPPTTEDLLSLQSFLIIASIPLLLLGAVIEERGQAKDQFLKAFRSSPSPIVIARQRDCCIIDVNECWEELFGYRREEAIGKTASDLGIYKCDADRESFKDAWTGGRPVRDFEMSVLTRASGERQVLISVEADEIGGEPCLILIVRDVTERKQAEEGLRNIAAGVSATTGKTFFRSLVEHISRVLQVDYAYVCEMFDKGDRARTLASYAGGKEVENIEYPLADSPCEQVLKLGHAVYPQGVKAKFPLDELLQSMPVEGYLGVCLKNSSGQPLGLMAVMSSRPLENVERAQTILSIFAARASAELERKQAEDMLRLREQDLRNSEERYREVVESQTDLICRFREDTTLTFVNEAYCRFFHRTREQLIGRKFLELVPEGSRSAALGTITALARELQPIAVEHEVILPDGRIGWMHWVNYAIVRPEGRVTEFQAIGRDVTQRRKAETALRESEERLRQMVEGVQDYAIFMLDLDGCVITWNTSAERITGFRADEIIGRHLSRFFRPEDVANGLPQKALDQARASGRSDMEGWRIRKDGTRFWASGIISVVKDDKGALRGFVKITHDLTERRNAEQALSESRRKLQLQKDQLQTLAGRLITAQEDERHRISRELHDDIAQRLCVLALRLHTVGRELPENAAVVRENIRAAQRFTDEIAMDVHQLSRELHSSRLRNLGLRRALDSWCQEMAAQHGIAVQVTMDDVDDLPSDIVLCVYRVVQEALNNAVKHGNAQQVSIDLARDSSGVRMRICDAGRGFDPEVAANGIGLASMRERLRFIGGDLTVKSAPGRGTELVAEIRFGAKSPPAPALTSVSRS
jgi:PAS domain S-box-containing protein